MAITLLFCYISNNPRRTFTGKYYIFPYGPTMAFLTIFLLYLYSMIETLPKLAYFFDYLRANPDTLILTRHKLQQKGPYINALFGLKNRWVVYDMTKIYWVREMLVPVGSHCEKLDRILAQLLQKHLQPTLDTLVQQYKEEHKDQEETKASTKMLILLHQRKGKRQIMH